MSVLFRVKIALRAGLGLANLILLASFLVSWL